METPNYRKASIYFDDETVLEVEQRGGGGSGVGGETGLAAVNLATGESTSEALAEKDETIEEQAGTIEEQEATIETQAATIIELQDANAELTEKINSVSQFIGDPTPAPSASRNVSVAITNNSAKLFKILVFGGFNYDYNSHLIRPEYNIVQAPAGEYNSSGFTTRFKVPVQNLNEDSIVEIIGQPLVEGVNCAIVFDSGFENSSYNARGEFSTRVKKSKTAPSWHISITVTDA